jgi:hypothetical protein
MDPSKITDISKVPQLSQTFEILQTLPIGWGGKDVSTPTYSLGNFFERPASQWDWARIFGWIITAFAALFGAPFWFDSLQQLIRLKGSGPSPKEKIESKGASA